MLSTGLMDAKLIVIGGKANKSEVKLKLPTTIGRSRKADLTVAHPKVSRQHCEIFERDGVLVVRDFGSLNGTYIGDARVTEAILRPGDKLTVGPLTFVAVYQHSGPIPAAPPNPADLPTPALDNLTMPEVTVKATAPDTVRTKAKPAPQSAAADPAQPAEAEIGPLDLDTPQPPTLDEHASPAGTEADDFGWLTGDTAAAPEDEQPSAEPVGEAASPAYAETVNLQRSEEDDAAEDELPLPLEPPASSGQETSKISSATPGDEAQDFSWLDNAQDKPLDFSAFEDAAKDAVASEAPPPAAQVADEVERTTTERSGPTLSIAKETFEAPELPPAAIPAAAEVAADADKIASHQAADALSTQADVVIPPAALAPAAEADETMMFEPQSPAAQDLSFDAGAEAAPTAQPPAEPELPIAAFTSEPAVADEGLPDFAAIAANEPAADEEVSFPDFAAMAEEDSTESGEAGFPAIVADRPVVPNAAPASPTAAPAKDKASKKAAAKKGWWPFGKKKEAGRKDAAAASEDAASEETPELEEAAEEVVPEPANEPMTPALAEATPAEAPPFFMPQEADAADPADDTAAQAAPNDDDDDPALGQFFKSLK